MQCSAARTLGPLNQASMPIIAGRSDEQITSLTSLTSQLEPNQPRAVKRCCRIVGRPQPWGSQKKVRDRLVSCLRCNLCVPIRKIRGETGLKPPRFHPLGSILGDITLNGFIARTLISPRCGATTLERHFRPQLAGGGLVGHCHVCCKRLQLRLCSISTSQGCEMR